MRGDQRVIEYLNKALRHELAAVNQYWLHYRILDNWGYRGFAKQWRAESIEEMQHADKLVARILFLDGAPNMQSLDQLRIGKDVKEIIECDLTAEISARTLYLEAAQYCDTANDRVSMNLFEQLTTDVVGAEMAARLRASAVSDGDGWRVPPADHVATRYELKRLGDTPPIFLEFQRGAVSKLSATAAGFGMGDRHG